MSIAGAQKPPSRPARSRLGPKRMDPILSWLPRYDCGWLPVDVIAGLPPYAGLYTLVSSLVFVIYGSSRPHLSCLRRVPDVPGAYTDLVLAEGIGFPFQQRDVHVYYTPTGTNGSGATNGDKT